MLYYVTFPPSHNITNPIFISQIVACLQCLRMTVQNPSVKWKYKMLLEKQAVSYKVTL